MASRPKPRNRRWYGEAYQWGPEGLNAYVWRGANPGELDDAGEPWPLHERNVICYTSTVDDAKVIARALNEGGWQ